MSYYIYLSFEVMLNHVGTSIWPFPSWWFDLESTIFLLPTLSLSKYAKHMGAWKTITFNFSFSFYESIWCHSLVIYVACSCLKGERRLVLVEDSEVLMLAKKALCLLPMIYNRILSCCLRMMSFCFKITLRSGWKWWSLWSIWENKGLES